MPPKRRTGQPPSYTEWHGNNYRAKLRIPEQLRRHFPADKSGTRFKKFLYENLRTDDPLEANRAAQAFVVRMRKRFSRIARRDRSSAGLLSEAERWQSAVTSGAKLSDFNETLASAESINAEELEELGIEQHYSEFDALVDRAYELEDKIGHARTMRFFKLASGKATLLSIAMEDWLRSETYSAATQARYRKIVENLMAWCCSNRIPETIEAINSAQAKRFLACRGSRSPKAIANERAALSSLWDWSNSRLLSDLNPKIQPYENWIGDHGDNPWRNVRAHVSSKTDRRPDK